MGIVLFGMTMSLDGFVNDRNGEVQRLYPDMEEMRNSEVLQRSIQATGAVVMGRGAYDMAKGDFTDYEFQVPIFVLTHTAPEVVAKGTNDRVSFTFVTDGLESLIGQAKSAAGDKDVTVIGGANLAQQLILAGLIDEIEISIMPVLLGDGLRLFENLSGDAIELEKIRVVEGPMRTDLTFRVRKVGDTR